MPKCLNLTLAGIVSCLVVGCATHSGLNLAGAQRRQNVRTTAYTHTERGGAHNALGRYLSGRQEMSAAEERIGRQPRPKKNSAQEKNVAAYAFFWHAAQAHRNFAG